MEKKYLVLIGIILIAGSVVATQIINDQLVVSWSGPDCFLVQNNLGIPHHHFSVDCSSGGNVFVSSLEPIGAPNPTIGTPSNKFTAYFGIPLVVQAQRGNSCNQLCDTLDGMQYSSYDWTCTDAFRLDGTIVTCADVNFQRNCLCRN